MSEKALALFIVALFAVTAQAADAGRVFVKPDGYEPKTAPPFSNGVMVGDTLYVAGHIGIDPATGQAASDADAETRLLMDAVKQTVEKAGLTMDEVVSETIYCTDLALYDKFNGIYRTYFPSGRYPARAFIGVNKLVRGAHFEIAAVAVKSPKTSKAK